MPKSKEAWLEEYHADDSTEDLIREYGRMMYSAGMDDGHPLGSGNQEEEEAKELLGVVLDRIDVLEQELAIAKAKGETP